MRGLAIGSLGWLSCGVMLRRSDRYVLREMIGPFALAIAGLVLFILLNIILSLSDLMVDRGISMPTLLRLVLLKVPSLLVVAVPMAVLFATFLGLGRMVHDREVVALESLGIPLRRVLLPLVLAAGVIAVADFGVYNWLVPASESAYQDALRGIIFQQGVPRITSNAFFKGPNDEFLYIRRYDESTGKLYDVHIYDTSGQLFPQAQAGGQTQLTMLTAEEGTRSGDAWSLTNAHVYGFDRAGNLTFSAIVASLALPIDQGITELLARSRTTTEMGMAELLTRVAQARANGQRVNEYLVEIHLKMALPLAAVIFVLVSGSLSLAFQPRSRAVGIVLALLLVAIYQGVLWWTQTLGRRAAMDPALAAWLPDILFGALGLLLFLRVDRLASRDVWSRLRTRLPLVVLSVLVVVSLASVSLHAAIPVHINCDQLFVSEDDTQLRASGNVSATFADTSIRADALVLEEVQSGSWRMSASGHVALATGEGLDVESDTLVAEMATETDNVRPQSAEATALAGSTRFRNSAGDETELYFRADRGRLEFESGRLTLLEAYGSELTTCHCCDVGIQQQPYSLRANRLLLYPDRLLVAYGITGSAGGVPLVWLPLYVQPLKETLEAPLFPAIGRSAERGWFAKWSLPYFVSQALYGNVNVDVYTRYGEIGLGGILRYDLGGERGEISGYHLGAKVGDSETSLKFQHTASLSTDWQGTGTLDYSAKGAKQRLSYSFVLSGNSGIGKITAAAARSLTTTTAGATHVSEQLPELSVATPALHVGTLRIEPRASAGWVREGTLGKPLDGTFRLAVAANAVADSFSLGPLRIVPEASIRGSIYDGPLGKKDQLALALTPTATFGDLTVTWASTWVLGASPLDSDRLTSGNELDWTLDRKGVIHLKVSGSYSLESGPGLLRASATWSAFADWTASGTFSPAEGRITAFDLLAKWTDGTRSATWHLPLDTTNRRFETSSLTLASKVDRFSLSLDLHADLAAHVISGWDLSAEVESVDGWGLTLGATYAAEAHSTLHPDFGLFKDIANCLRIGIEQAKGDTWLYISILAFPEAVLRYAPLSFDVEVGS